MRLWCASVLALALAQAATAQGTRADYERAAGLRESLQGKMIGDTIRPQWLEGGTKFWYRIQRAGGANEFVLIDAATGVRSPLFDADRLAAALQVETGRDVDPKRLPIERVIASGSHITFIATGDQRIWSWNVSDRMLATASPEQAKAFELAQAERSGAAARGRRGGNRGQAAADGRETAIIFQNRTKDRVRLFWISGENDRRSYGEVAPGGEHRQHTFSGHRWVVTDAAGNDVGFFAGENEPAIAVIDAASAERAKTQATRPAGDGQQVGAPRQARGASPDGTRRAFVRDRNLFLADADGSNEVALTTDGTTANGFDGRVFWSPDSTKLIAMRGTPGDERKVYYVESAPADQLQPKLHEYDYLKPGDNVPQYWPRLFNVALRREILISRDLCSNPFSLDSVRWMPDSSAFTFMYNQRGHQVLRLIEVNATTGASRAIIDETSATFINYSGKMFIHLLPKTGEIIWMSERDGWNHLYLYDSATGSVKNQITKGEWVVREVDRVDEDRRQIWFRAGGIYPDQDPYHVHYCRINIDGTGLVVLTEGDGTHDIEFSPDREYFIDRWSRIDQPPITELRRSNDGSLVRELERADITALQATGWKPPERFVAKGRDGVTDIHGIIIRPSNFDPTKKYPVIEAIYAGPQDSFVPKSFRTYDGAQELGELGFIIVRIDGMGTSNRSKAFHDVCWQNLADAGFADRILWMKAAAAKHPEMDLTRVGIYGGSAGGQNALGALLLHGDFYKAAAADCGCHDNRMDKIWWNEQWMGWPVGEHYAAQSNVTLAKNLTGKLLLTVGEADENVDPASTMQVADALIAAGKDFEFIVFPGGGHGSGESPYGRRRRQDFFVRSLMGVEPRGQP